jgi:hypothetical protein
MGQLGDRRFQCRESARLDETAKSVVLRKSASNVTAGKGTVADLITVYETRNAAKTDLKHRSQREQ